MRVTTQPLGEITVGRFVNVIPLDGAVNEAIAGDCCLGNVELIRSTFFGLMLSMADGVRRTNGRGIAADARDARPCHARQFPVRASTTFRA